MFPSRLAIGIAYDSLSRFLVSSYSAERIVSRRDFLSVSTMCIHRCNGDARLGSPASVFQRTRSQQTCASDRCLLQKQSRRRHRSVRTRAKGWVVCVFHNTRARARCTVISRLTRYSYLMSRRLFILESIDISSDNKNIRWSVVFLYGIVNDTIVL